jgi:hypothetical protein
MHLFQGSCRTSAYCSPPPSVESVSFVGCVDGIDLGLALGAMNKLSRRLSSALSPRLREFWSPEYGLRPPTHHATGKQETVMAADPPIKVNHTSIHHFPYEILEQILLLAEEPTADAYSRGYPKDIKRYAKKLRLVCRTWKAIVDANALFLETILHLGYTMPDYAGLQGSSELLFNENIDNFGEHLAGAGRSDLVVNIRVEGPFGRSKPIGPEYILAEKFALVAPYSSQIRRIHLHLDTIHLGAMIADALKRFSDLTRLLELTIFGDQTGDPFPKGKRMDLTRAINMVSLSLVRVNLMKSIKPPKGLRKVVIEGPAPEGWDDPIQISWSDFHPFLQSCSHLQSLTLCRIALLFPGRSRRLDIPTLRTLVLKNSTYMSVLMARKINAPDLESLEVQFDDSSHLSPVRQFSERGQSFPQFLKLRSLTVDTRLWGESVEELIEKASASPLETLTLHFRGSATILSSQLQTSKQLQTTASHLRLEYRGLSGLQPQAEWCLILGRLDLSKIKLLTAVVFERPASTFDPQPTNPRLIPLPSLVDLCLTDFGAADADAFCKWLDAPSLKMMKHESTRSNLLSPFRAPGPFPRPRKSKGFPFGGPPAWYGNLTTLEITTCLSIPGSEHVLPLFPKAETLCITIPILKKFGKAEEKLFSPLAARISPAMPKLRRLVTILYQHKGKDVAARHVGYACKGLLERVVTQRKTQGLGALDVEIFNELEDCRIHFWSSREST